ncbi:hypothetical protein A9F13_14g00319 [Clavispora lusitaniae]|uniref:Uncharacterized protein n=1 Tax=Clavispora lusitaniae TaxID=36911 RepID=A0AA91T0I8_CLALS|nr:hypothetical protein A9F13_14g00319 [Clavispora lusitaniae]
MRHISCAARPKWLEAARSAPPAGFNFGPSLGLTSAISVRVAVFSHLQNVSDSDRVDSCV